MPRGSETTTTDFRFPYASQTKRLKRSEWKNRPSRPRRPEIDPRQQQRAHFDVPTPRRHTARANKARRRGVLVPISGRRFRVHGSITVDRRRRVTISPTKTRARTFTRNQKKKPERKRFETFEIAANFANKTAVFLLTRDDRTTGLSNANDLFRSLESELSPYNADSFGTEKAAA